MSITACSTCWLPFSGTWKNPSPESRNNAQLLCSQLYNLYIQADPDNSCRQDGLIPSTLHMATTPLRKSAAAVRRSNEAPSRSYATIIPNPMNTFPKQGDEKTSSKQRPPCKVLSSSVTLDLCFFTIILAFVLVQAHLFSA